MSILFFKTFLYPDSGRYSRDRRSRPTSPPPGTDLTTDLKLTRYPRSLAATLAAFPSVSLFPQLGSRMTRISRTAIGTLKRRNVQRRTCNAKRPMKDIATHPITISRSRLGVGCPRSVSSAVLTLHPFNYATRHQLRVSWSITAIARS
jgi:hypothetical protein